MRQLSDRTEPLRRRTAVVFILVIAALPSESAEAQSEGAPILPFSSFVGYSANLPDQVVGFSYGEILHQRWGIYIDVKISVGVPGSASSDYREDMTVVIAEALGHTWQAEKTGYFSLNLGTTRWMGSRLAVYGGLGLCAVQPYSQYHDPSGLFGPEGGYWIDTKEQSIRTNLMLGALYPVSSRILLQLGVETLPRGITVGLGWLVQDHGKPQSDESLGR